MNTHSNPVNPLVRLQDQLHENALNGLIPPEPIIMTTEIAAHHLYASLDHSVALGIITKAEQEELRSQALSSNANKLIQAKTSVGIINGLFQGIDILPDQANDLIKFFCAAEVNLSGQILIRMLEDLRAVDGILSELRSGEKITQEQYEKVSDNRIGLNRVIASLKI